jgi:hypothetical protein
MTEPRLEHQNVKVKQLIDDYCASRIVIPEFHVANIAFFVGDVNKSIGQSGPEVYLKRLGAKVLDSQCIPTDRGLWAVDRADDFWEKRRELLADSFNDFLRNSLPQCRLSSV